jgi:UDP-N-acetylmuramate dehydrogenase
MNAGAYGGEMAGVTESVSALSGGEPREYGRDDCGFSYRHSVFGSLGGVITGAVLRLGRGDKTEIRARREHNNERRRQNTPINLHSAGSVFKRPAGDYAARLIDEAGLKGLTIGGARVSELHSGFIVNAGGASSSDIYELIQRVRGAVCQKSGVTLELEIRLIGEF